MREWISERHRSLSGWKTLAPVVLAVSVLAGASASAATTDSSASNASVAEAGVPPGTNPMAAYELYALYRDKSWQWRDESRQQVTRAWCTETPPESAHSECEVW